MLIVQGLSFSTLMMGAFNLSFWCIRGSVLATIVV